MAHPIYFCLVDKKKELPKQPPLDVSSAVNSISLKTSHNLSPVKYTQNMFIRIFLRRIGRASTEKQMETSQHYTAAAEA